MKHASNLHVVGIYNMQFSCMQVVHVSCCKNHVTCMLLHAQDFRLGRDKIFFVEEGSEGSQEAIRSNRAAVKTSNCHKAEAYKWQ